MKHIGLALMVGLMSSYNAVASELPSPILDVAVHSTDSEKLSIQNLSFETVKIDIYGKEFNLKPSSGLTFECEGYQDLELLFTDVIHDYFEVPCRSEVVITESYITSK